MFSETSTNFSFLPNQKLRLNTVLLYLALLLPLHRTQTEDTERETALIFFFFLCLIEYKASCIRHRTPRSLNPPIPAFIGVFLAAVGVISSRGVTMWTECKILWNQSGCSAFISFSPGNYFLSTLHRSSSSNADAKLLPRSARTIILPPIFASSTHRLPRSFTRDFNILRATLTHLLSLCLPPEASV